MSRPIAPFRSATIFGIPTAVNHEMRAALGEEVEVYPEAGDPKPHDWRNIGFAPVTSAANDYIHDLDGIGLVMCVRFSDRILPAGVIREHKLQRIRELEAKGEILTRKEKAEVADEVIGKLLPKAFVRRTDVYVVITNDGRLLVHSTSQKKVEEVLGLLTTWLERELIVDLHPLIPFRPANDPCPILTDLIVNGTSDVFFPTDRATLFIDNDQSVRVSKRSLEAGEIVDLIQTGYQASQLALSMRDPTTGDELVTFKLDERFAITSLRGDALKIEDAHDFHATAYVAVRMYQSLANELENFFDGYKPDDEDEL